MSSFNYYSDDWRTWVFKQVDFFIKKNQCDRILDLLKKEIEQRPLGVETILHVYHSLMIHTGETYFAKKILRLYLSYNRSISLASQATFELPQFANSLTVLGRLGEAADQTASIIYLRRLKVLKNKLVLCVLPEANIANSAFLPYMSEAFEIVTDIENIMELRSVMPLAPYDSMYPYYSEEIFGHNNTFLKDIFPVVRKNRIPIKPFSLKDDTVEIAEPLLKRRFNFRTDDKFVVVHVREEGYFDRPHHALRNRSISSYVPAIKWLIAEGFKIFRIGNPKMSEIDKMTGLIDLTREALPGEVDIYLLAKATFYFGSSSGPFSLADQFGTPTLIFEELPYSARTNSIVHLMKIIDQKSGKIQTVSEIYRLLGLDSNAPRPFLEKGLIQVPLTANEILKITKDMVTKLPKLSKENPKTYPVADEVGKRFLGELDDSSLELLLDES